MVVSRRGATEVPSGISIHADDDRIRLPNSNIEPVCQDTA